MSEDTFKKVISHAKEHGFVFQSSEIYDGLSATYDYGQNGVELKNNIKKYWWAAMVQMNENVVGLDAAIFMHPKTWKASGHVDTFTDPLVECSNCKGRFREDQIDLSKCPSCNKENTVGEARPFNMMFETKVGPTASEIASIELDKNSLSSLLDKMNESGQESKSLIIDNSHREQIGANTAFLRPETAQGIFTNFKNILSISWGLNRRDLSAPTIGDPCLGHFVVVYGVININIRLPDNAGNP